MTTSNRFKFSPVAIAAGYRSGLEKVIADRLAVLKVNFRYEEDTFCYTKPARISKYTPDFVLPNGIIIESKGQFKTADRQKHVLIKAQHPLLEIRFVFSNPNQRISKTSKTTYAMWCDTNGFLYAKRMIPQEWIDAGKSLAWLHAIQVNRWEKNK